MNTMEALELLKWILILAAIAALAVFLVYLAVNGGDIKKAANDAKNWIANNFKPFIFGLLVAGLLIALLPFLLPIGAITAGAIGIGGGGAVFLGSGGYIKQPEIKGDLSVTLDRYWKDGIEYYTANNQPTGRTQ